MIKKKKQLKQILYEEKKFYLPKESAIELIITSDNKFKLFKYVKTLRKCEYHYNNRDRFINRFCYVFLRRKKNILGRKLGVEMSENSFEQGLMIHHSQGIVVNGYARIGKNCILHGNNCIGNNGVSYDAPVLGNGVRLGVGAKIIGNVTIADNVTIAAGAVVIESCNIEGAVLAGVPAKCVKVPKITCEVKNEQ